MEKNNLSKIEEIITEHSLRPASLRDLPLLSLSVIAIGYTSFIRKLLGISYQAVGGIGGNGRSHSMLNEKRIVEDFHNFLEKNYKNLVDVTFKIAQKTFKTTLDEFEAIQSSSKNSPHVSFRRLIEIYPNYIAAIGVYNCFWRYLGNDSSKGRLTEEFIKRISPERESLAKFYPRMEKTLEEITLKIGDRENYDGDLLRYLTNEELEKMENFSINKERLEELSKRRDGYFYVYVESEDRHYLTTDPSEVRFVKKKYYDVSDRNIKEIKGHQAFGGKVRGIVHNIQQNGKNGVKNDMILVTSMTHPDDIELIKKSAAIVTNEGGILSHAAIVSRELKKPCIIGTKIATQVLKSGDMVEVDADNGIIRIIS